MTREPRGARGDYHDISDISVPGAFARRFAINPRLIPWSHRNVDLVAGGLDIADCIDSLPPTRASFEGVGNGNLPVELYLAHGAFPIPGTSNPKRYANPEYVHRHGESYPHVTTTTDRRWWLYRYGMLGRVATVETIVAHFGLAAGDHAPVTDPTDVGACTAAVAEAADVCGLTFGTYRDRGDAHMGRVFAITMAWTEATAARVADAYAVTPECVHRLVECAKAVGFEVPPEPAGVDHGFAGPENGE